MVAESQDQNGVTSQDASCVVSTQLETESKTLASNGTGYPPKARKPYTITKQRERWTGEEHQRFIEALKMYGRAWRQIEEHVGTKTAIQIRSHAQKFFAKVTRDSSNDAEGSVNTIEIPPPRPKKKPLHPYPCKLVDSSKTEAVVSHQPERSVSPFISAAERENLSPTSVLSAFRSDTSESADARASHLSPASCATDEHSANLLSTENDNDYVKFSLPAEEDKDVHLSFQISSTVQDNKTTMKLELFSQDTACSAEHPATEEPHASIKLFGKIVVVRDTPKQSLAFGENRVPLPSDATNENSDFNCEKLVHGLTSNDVNSQVTFGFVSNSASHPCWLPQHPLSNIYSNVESHPRFPFWVSYHGLVCPYVSSCIPAATENVAHSPLKEGAKDEELPMERTSANSDNRSVTEANSHGKECDSIVSKRLPRSGREKTKGFVPYKRCVAERDMNSSMSGLEEQGGQRARVCS